MSASTILSAWVSVRFTARGSRLFRNFVGGVWAGKKTASGTGKHGPFVVISSPTHIDAGLCVGSSDRIGWTPVKIAAGYSEAQMREAFERGRYGGRDGEVISFRDFMDSERPTLEARTVAVFTAVEEKTLAYRKLTPEQINFLDQVVAAGGLGYVARETKDGPALETWPPITKDKA